MAETLISRSNRSQWSPRLRSLAVLLLGVLASRCRGGAAAADSDSSYVRHRSLEQQDLRFLQDVPLQNENATASDLNCTETCCLALCASAPVEASSSWISVIPTAVQWILVLILVSFSALFSGLTLGLLRLVFPLCYLQWKNRGNRS
jgi:hypothetical protein